MSEQHQNIHEMPAAGRASPQRVDPFNFPMPQRSDLMSLSSINYQKDNMKTTTVKFQTRRQDSLNLFVNDIQGASPKLHGSRQVQVDKDQWNLSNLDIERSYPRQLHFGLSNKPDNQMKVDDIKWAKPQCVKFTTTRIGGNPLNPQYKLQSVEYVNPEPLKFIRDQQYIDDIEGTRPTKKKQLDISTRDIMNISDIDGTKARARHAPRPGNGTSEQIFDQMDYRDVTNVDFKTKRTTNPLNPVYVHREEDGTLVQIGEVKGSHPQVLPPPRLDKNFTTTSLKTSDIHGCAIGTKRLGSFHTRQRKEYKNTNQIDDIIGAQASSLKKGVESTRCLHPLMPQYQFPGRLELTDVNDAFGKKNPVQQAVLERYNKKNEKTFQNAALETLEGQKLFNASRTAQDQPGKSIAQKLDSFIQK